MKEVILKANLAGIGYSGKKGQKITVSDEIAKDLINAKLASNPPKKKVSK